MMAYFTNVLTLMLIFSWQKLIAQLPKHIVFWMRLPIVENRYGFRLTLEDAEPIAGQPLLRSGESLTDLLSSLTDRMPAAVLFNCSQPEVMDDAVNSVMANLADQPNPPKIGVLANAFPLMKKIMKGLMKASMYLRGDITPEAYADFAQQWAASGAG